MPERNAAARKGPAQLGGEDLDEVFAPKKVAAAPGAGGAAAGSKEEGRGGHAGTLSVPEDGDDKPTSSTLRIPGYLSDNISEYLHDHKGDNMQTMFFKGLVGLGIHVRPEDLKPKRQRRSR
jgi:hypothetical protein